MGADPLPGDPGTRRRRAVPDRAGGHRRPVHPGRAGQVPGPLRSRLRDRLPGRPGPGRLPDRQLQLALGLLRQPADRDRGPGRDLPTAAEHQGPPAGHQDRLRRRGDPDPRANADPDRPDPGRDFAVERPGRVGLDRRGPRLPGHLRLRRVAGGGADHPAPPVPQPDVQRLDGRDLPGHLRLRRRDHLPAAVLPDRPGLERDGVGLPAPAVPDRPDRRLDRLGHRRQPDRSLQGDRRRRPGDPERSACT